MKRWLAFLAFWPFYVREVVTANARVAWAVLFPSSLRPGIVRLPVDGLTPRQRLALSNLLTMTPGTLCYDFSPDGATAYIHTLFVDGSADACRAVWTRDYVQRIRDAF